MIALLKFGRVLLMKHISYLRCPGSPPRIISYFLSQETYLRWVEMVPRHQRVFPVDSPCAH